jgi:hypothetical protein
MNAVTLWDLKSMEQNDNIKNISQLKPSQDLMGATLHGQGKTA